MDDFKKNLLLLLSLGLNVALITVLVVGVWFRGGEKSDRDRRGWSGFYHETLEVTDEQWDELKPAIDEFRTRRRRQCQEVTERRRELLDRLREDRPVADLLDEITRSQRRMQTIVIDHIREQRGTLTADQREKYFRRLRRHTSC